MMYLLMDARAASDPDKAIVIDTGTAEDMCRAANRGDFGDGCVVADEHEEVQWAWFASGKWKAPVKS